MRRRTARLLQKRVSLDANGEVAAIQAVISGKKAAFLLPYRALVNEKFEEFTERHAAAGLRVVRGSGDATDGIGPVLTGRCDLGFFTYETFLNLALGTPRVLNRLGLVVLDEGQFITDPHRGITAELICSLLLRARQRGIEPQLLILSAVIGNLNSFDRWLIAPLLLSRERPVPLTEGGSTGVERFSTSTSTPTARRKPRPCCRLTASCSAATNQVPMM